MFAWDPASRVAFLAPARTSLEEQLRVAHRQRLMHADKPFLARQLDLQIADLRSRMRAA